MAIRNGFSIECEPTMQQQGIKEGLTEETTMSSMKGNFNPSGALEISRFFTQLIRIALQAATAVTRPDDPVFFRMQHLGGAPNCRPSSSCMDDQVLHTVC